MKKTPEYERIYKLLNQPIQSIRESTNQGQLKDQYNVLGSNNSSPKKTFTREQKNYESNTMLKHNRQLNWIEHGSFDRMPQNRVTNNTFGQNTNQNNISVRVC